MIATKASMYDDISTKNLELTEDDSISFAVGDFVVVTNSPKDTVCLGD